MLGKLCLMYNTIRCMKPSQIHSRVKRVLHMPCSLAVKPLQGYSASSLVASPEELDFDPVQMKRFSVDDFCNGTVCFLHEREQMNWDGAWNKPSQTALWNFNLHYFEFLMPIIRAYQESYQQKYLKAVQDSINGWIEANPCKKGGTGWAAYTISLRLVNWLSCLFWMQGVLEPSFVAHMTDSIHEQYLFLAQHLEKDLLANHYLENLKALIMCALFFQDERMLERSLREWKKQCAEQILSDGMHFERSPMYHKIVLEDVLRVAYALRQAGRKDCEVERYLQSMLDVAYSFEHGLERIPLFNDGGNNVAKGLEALALTANRYFGIVPKKKGQMPEAGFYILEQGEWKVIVDAGNPGPTYNPGHAHCEAMSFELYHQGVPVLVNCGTYAYQSNDRAFFRSTAAHNTVMMNGEEQSQYWGAFRMGRRSSTEVLCADEHHIVMTMKDWRKQTVCRSITLKDNELCIQDQAVGQRLCAMIHFSNEKDISRIHGDTENGVLLQPKLEQHWYAVDYGSRSKIQALAFEAMDNLTIRMSLSE